MLYYTGIGSRKTPDYALTAMWSIANSLASMGFILRSGGAKGADTAFEDGANALDTDKEIYLPWKDFNNNKSMLILDDMINKEIAYKIAYKYHPNWMACNDTARAFHARNSYQVLGQDLNTPSSFVICWTPGNAVTGGTGQALRIAIDHNIPIMYL